MERWSAIVLTGGTGARLGGVDKAGLVIAGRPLLDRLIDALPVEVPVIIAGPPRPVQRPAEFVVEDPPSGGPAAGIVAALGLVSTPLVGTLAVDVPAGATVMDAALGVLQDDDDADVVVPVDADGRRQVLCSAWRTDALRSAAGRHPDWHGRPVRDLLAGMRVRELPLSRGELDDIDTPEDLEKARRGW